MSPLLLYIINGRGELRASIVCKSSVSERLRRTRLASSGNREISRNLDRNVEWRRQEELWLCLIAAYCFVSIVNRRIVIHEEERWGAT